MANVVYLHGGDRPNAVLRYGRVMLLTYGCEFDKKACECVMVAEIRPLSTVVESTRQYVRDYRVLHMFYLPEAPGAMPESFVDFRMMERISKDTLLRLSDARELSVTDDAQLALQEQLSLFFGLGRQERHAAR